MRTFFKFLISSFGSTIIDFSLTILLTENLKVFYTTSSIIGFVSGGITNFIINKNWVFRTKDSKKAKQALLYVIIWFVSLFINTLVLYLLTDFGAINYKYSKIFASLFVCITMSFIAQKKIVFHAHPIKN